MSEEKLITIEDVIENQQKLRPDADVKLIKKAYEFAKSNHGEQLRVSGEPYMIHPVNVAYILSTLEMDDETICAALLHDVIEDTDKTYEDIEKENPEENEEINIENWNGEKLRNISYMFYNNSSLKTLNIEVPSNEKLLHDKFKNESFYSHRKEDKYKDYDGKEGMCLDNEKN